MPPERRRELADRQIASLRRQSVVLEGEGAYSEAQRAVDAAAEWDFWAVHGVTPDEWDEANS